LLQVRTCSFLISFTNDKVGGRKMNILNIELTSIEETKLGFEHWVNVTYSVPILKNEYTVKLLLLLDFKLEDKELLDYLVSTWKYRDLVLHSVQMYEMENK
jgi:hypothetical protein